MALRPDLSGPNARETFMNVRLTHRIQIMAALVFLLAVNAASAQTYTVLYNFGLVSCDPLFPLHVGAIAQGRDGNLYSTTSGGGCNSNGAAFKISPTGKLTLLHSFSNGTDGIGQESGLTLGT